MKKLTFFIIVILVILSWIFFHRANAEKKKLIGSGWVSQPFPKYSYTGRKEQVIELHFYADSVTFFMPDGSSMDVAQFLPGKAAGKSNYYSWDYKVDGTSIVLDPGMFGIAVPLEVSGDSLIWQGKVPDEIGHLAFRRSQ